jgi:polysaccharide deacetylase family protein (PEP-CTERM system associated)
MTTMNTREIENALSFDVEDYFHVSSFEEVVRREDWGRYDCRVLENTRRILDMLESFSTKATFFVLGWVAENCPQVVEEISRQGHEIACHGFEHRLAYRMTPDEFREDVLRAKRAIESVTGKPVLGFRAASFSIVKGNLWVLRSLAELGFLYDSSIFPVRHNRYGIPDYPRFPSRFTFEGIGGAAASMVEFPLSTTRIGPLNLPIAGGGYLRLLSYFYVRWGLRRVNREGQPGVVYLHPWELDPQQPRIRCNLRTRILHYSGLRRTAGSLRRLLEEFRFAPLRKVLESRGLLEA